jgi:RNA polymerase sigma-70 factor (ECF subfamily)
LNGVSTAKAIPIDEALAAQKYSESRAADYGLSAASFRAILAAIAAKYCSDLKERDALFRTLRYEELALARGCAAGNERAWTEFLTRYRAKLYDSARAITREDASAHELADGIYAELYGTELRDGVRRSKLAHYSGRGSLDGWLRTVLAQEWVNRYRKVKREVSIEEQEEAGVQFPADRAATPATVNHAPLVSATDAALAELSAEDRYILASYHLDGRKLAEIAKTLGVHESTISRRVEKIAGQVRSGILKHLQKGGMSRRQAEEALEADVRDVQIDLRTRLAQAAPENLSRSISSPGLQAGTSRAFSEGEPKQ